MEELDINKFKNIKKEYYSTIETINANPENLNIIDSLRNDGIAVIPNFANPDVIELANESIPMENEFNISPEGDEALYFPNAGKIKNLEFFFSNERIKNIAQAYLSKSAVALRQYIRYKKRNKISFESFYHIDTWKKRMKAFLYLSDVSEENAPLVYLKGSHKGAWRIQKEAELFYLYRNNNEGFALNKEVSYLGCYWPHEVQSIKKRYNLSDISCSYRAGTLIIFDGRGLHYGAELKTGERKLLMSYWIDNGNHI